MAATAFGNFPRDILRITYGSEHHRNYSDRARSLRTGAIPVKLIIMKLKLIIPIFLSSALLVHGQGTFLWDQQSTGFLDGSAPIIDQPLGQAFTPTQSSMDVAAFNLSNVSTSPAEVEMNILSGSITGTVLGTSMPVTIPGATFGSYDFFFAAPIDLTPGMQYYLQPVTVSGSGIDANTVNVPVPTGGAIYNGVLHNGFDFWYQEGIVVPEPSLSALFVVASGIVFLRRRRK